MIQTMKISPAPSSAEESDERRDSFAEDFEEMQQVFKNMDQEIAKQQDIQYGYLFKEAQLLSNENLVRLKYQIDLILQNRAQSESYKKETKQSFNVSEPIKQPDTSFFPFPIVGV